MTSPSRTVTRETLAAALHEANIDCDYSWKFDRKSCAPSDGPHSIAADAILAALSSVPVDSGEERLTTKWFDSWPEGATYVFTKEQMRTVIEGARFEAPAPTLPADLRALSEAADAEARENNEALRRWRQTHEEWDTPPMNLPVKRDRFVAAAVNFVREALAREGGTK